MATIIENTGKDFTPHPEGTFIAIMRDAYLRTRPNPWKGTVNDKGQEDVRETITDLVLEFLTENEVEIGGKMLPGFVRYSATASVADNSNLRKFLKAWFPALKDEHFKRYDADKLIGKGAYITVAHREDKKGNVWANVVGAMQPPKGSELPAIPADFVRHEIREASAIKEDVKNGSKDIAPQDVEDDDDLPF